MSSDKPADGSDEKKPKEEPMDVDAELDGKEGESKKEKLSEKDSDEKVKDKDPAVKDEEKDEETKEVRTVTPISLQST